VDETTPSFYHCISRCVRHAFLCGEDALTGRSFAHRKQWAEDRLLELAEVFAVGVYAYAVMSNHLHDMVYLAPSATVAWSPDEAAQRWVRFTPARADGGIDEAACEARATALAGNPERIAVMREWLGSLSWCMRILNEPIVRRANGEDECTGHFWEARFKCQALLDDAAVLACMAYVDLNPIRTGLERGLPGSPHTSAQRPCKRCPAAGRGRPGRRLLTPCWRGRRGARKRQTRTPVPLHHAPGDQRKVALDPTAGHSATRSRPRGGMAPRMSNGMRSTLSPGWARWSRHPART
jgi:REP element-mobilizing transposase RayT